MDVPGKHLLDYWFVLVRRRWVLYLAVTAVTLAALVGSYLVTPLYRATTTLQIERQNPEIFTFRDLASVDYSWSAYSDFYETQYKILASDAVARATVERLDLVRHPLFEPDSSRPGVLDRLRALLPRTTARVQRDPTDLAAQRVQAGLEVTPVRNSHLVRLSWIGPDPALAAQVANALAGAYIDFNLQSQFKTSDSATEFLVNQTATLRQEIGSIEARLQDYGEAKGILSIDDADNITLRAVSDLAQRRTEARANLARAEAAFRAAQQAPPEGMPEVLHSDLIARLKGEYAAYEAEYSEKSRQFKDDWPEMQHLKSRMEQASERLRLETLEIARKVLLAAESEYRRARQEHDSLDALLHRQESEAQHLKRDAVEFANLEGEVLKKREMLGALIARQNEMSLSSRLKDLDVGSSNIRVVDEAKPPAAPFRPDKRLNLVLGLVLGLGLGIGMAFFLDYLDSTVASPADVEKVVDLPVLAVIPRHGEALPMLARARRREPAAESAPVDLVAYADGRARTAEAYRELRTAVLLSSAGRPPRRILCTSAMPEEGKSATAVNLSIVLAQLDRRVLLVDTDLRRPRLHRVFGIDNRKGMSTYLSGLEADVRRLVIGTVVPGLDLVPSGPIPPNPSELLNSALFETMAERLFEAGYDHLIYDSPPALSVSDPLVVARAMDAVILVVRAGRTPRESLRLAAEKFLQIGVRPTGIVLNDLDLEAQGHKRYGYSLAYGEAVDGEQASKVPERHVGGLRS